MNNNKENNPTTKSKQSSKILVILIFIIGIILLVFGVVTIFISPKEQPKPQSSKTKEETNSETKTPSEQTDEPTLPVESNVTCTATTTEANIKKTITYGLLFTDNNLQSYTKELLMVPSKSNGDITDTIEPLYSTYLQLQDTQINGYSFLTGISKNQLTATLSIDLNILNREQLNATPLPDDFGKIDFELNTPKSEITKNLKSLKYKCK